MNMFKPMKGSDCGDVISTLNYNTNMVAQPKYDGIRVIFLNGVALSSSMKPLRNEWLQNFARREAAILDSLEGEIWFDKDEGGLTRASSFANSFGSLDNQFRLAFFDCINPTDPYRVRLARASDKVNQLADDCYLPCRPSLAPTVDIKSPTEALATLKTCLDIGYEGIMLKDYDGKYKFGRSTVREQLCLKWKPFVDADGWVVDFDYEYENTNEAFIDELGRTKRSSAQEGKVAKPLIGRLKLASPAFSAQFWIAGFTQELKERMYAERETLLGRNVCFKHQPCGCYDAPRHPVFRRFI